MNDLGTAMRDVAEHVDVRAGFVGDVLRGGQRRLALRRRGLAVAMAAVVGLIGFGAGVLVRVRSDPGPLDVRLLEPTKGNLANDRSTLLRATELWRSSTAPTWREERGVTEFRGGPHVYWAGVTFGGDAAVVMQEAKAQDRWQTMVGLIATDPADGVRKLVGSTNPRDPAGLGESFQFGWQDRTFLVLDRPTPVYLSQAAAWDHDGRAHRTWTLVKMDDGVGLWTVPEGSDPATTRLVATDDPPTATVSADRLLTTRPASSYVRDGIHARRTGAPAVPAAVDRLFSAGTRLLVGADARTPPIDVDPVALLRAAGMTDLGPDPRAGTWRIRGRLPDGELVLVGEYQQNPRPSALYAVLLTDRGTPEQVLRGSEVEPSSVAVVRLPDDRGWVAAADGKQLRYRTSTGGDWLGSDTSAALLPHDAVQVQVGTQVVDLTR